MGFTALIAGGIGAAGSIGSALIGSNASSNASSQQVQEQQQALAVQQAMYQQGLTQQQNLFNQGEGQQLSLYNQGLGNQANYFNTAQSAYGAAQNALAPYAQAGQSVLPTLQGLLTPGANQSALLAQTPGFQFASQYGTKAATNALASKGLGASAGPLATAISQYNNGLASTTWGNVVGSLQNYANLGSTAAGGMASSSNAFAGIAGNAGNAALSGGVTAGGNILGNATSSGNAALSGGVQAGNAQAGTLGNIGNASAAGTLGSANALASGLTGATGGISNALLLSSFANGGNGGTNGLYSPNALENGPSNSAISGASDASIDQYEKMFGGG